MEEQPPTTVSDGRSPRGRFLPGNKASKGNVCARKAAQCRAKLFATISLQDFTEVDRQLVTEAKSGQAWAVKLLFSYLLGEPLPFDIDEQLRQIEERLKEKGKS